MLSITVFNTSITKARLRSWWWWLKISNMEWPSLIIMIVVADDDDDDDETPQRGTMHSSPDGPHHREDPTWGVGKEVMMVIMVILMIMVIMVIMVIMAKRRRRIISAIFPNLNIEFFNILMLSCFQALSECRGDSSENHRDPGNVTFMSTQIVISHRRNYNHDKSPWSW